MQTFKIKVQKDEDEDFRFKSNEERAHQELEKNMQMEAINVDLSMDQLERSKKHYRDIKIKRNVLFGALVLAFLSIIVFGAKKTFFDHKYTGPEIAAMANYYNKETNFPTNGIPGFLDKNIETLLKNKITIGTTVNEVKITNPIITKISEKSNTLANVYFYITIESNNGAEYVYCMLPMMWDQTKLIYSPGGDVIFTPNQSTVDDTDKAENPYLSFDGIEKEGAGKIESSQIFVNNFFTMLYSEKDVSPYYDSANGLLKASKGTTFNSMSEYVLYTESNKNGYNAYAKVSLSLPNGISYITEKYISIKQSGESWIITSIL